MIRIAISLSFLVSLPIRRPCASEHTRGVVAGGLCPSSSPTLLLSYATTRSITSVTPASGASAGRQTICSRMDHRRCKRCLAPNRRRAVPDLRWTALMTFNLTEQS